MAKKGEFLIIILSALRHEVTPARLSSAVPAAPSALSPPPSLIAELWGAPPDVHSYRYCGVGMQNALRATTLLCRQERIRALYFVGSAGALNPRLAPGTIAIPQHISYHPAEGAHHAFSVPLAPLIAPYLPDWHKEQRGHAPLDAAPPPIGLDDKGFACHIDAIARGFTLTRAPMLCSEHAITDDNERRSLFNRYHADAVDMESYAVACVARYYRIPLVVIKYITDCRRADLATFRSNLLKCARALQEIIEL